MFYELIFRTVVIYFFILINRKLRLFVYGKPQIIIKNGKILLKEMKKARYNLDDLITQLREKGIFDIKDVETGILEYSGKLSVLLKPQKRGVTTEDLGVDVSREWVPVVLMMDRKIVKKGLRVIGQDEKWLLKKLEDKGFSLDKVFLASLTTDGVLFISEYKQ